MSTLAEIHATMQQRRAVQARLTAARAQCAQADAERQAAIVAAHQAGLSVRDIADHVGVAKTTVHTMLKALASTTTD